MSLKEKSLHHTPFVELPDPKIRYLIWDNDNDHLVFLSFEDDGTPKIEYFACVSSDVELYILRLIRETQRHLYGY